MKEKFRAKKLNGFLKISLGGARVWQPSVENLLSSAGKIIESYQGRGIKMTLRQLYYQLVAKDIIPNHIKVYKKLSSLLTDARYNGLIDWDSIIDRVRLPEFPGEWESIKDIVGTAIHSFRLPRWENQKFYVELHTEKDALATVLVPLAQKYHVPFCVNRGYSSATAIYDLSKRIFKKIRAGKKARILYLGDHDPSGLDMVRDIRDRVEEMFPAKTSDEFEICHIGITADQIKEYDPPPNPAKVNDPRAVWYIEKHGDQSWEVDALPPEIMEKIVEESILTFLDRGKYQAAIDEEKRQVAKLKKLMGEL